MAPPGCTVIRASQPRGAVRRRSRQAGWSLVDLLLSSLFIALLAAILHSTSIAAMHAVRVREVADDLDENARIALEIMARDIRDCGYGLATATDRGLRDATPTRIRVARDLDLDGETASAGERVSYALFGSSRQLRRQAGDAAPQPMVDNLVAEQELFRFFDGDGNEISGAAAGGDLDERQRATVRWIEITLSLDAPHPIPGELPITAEHRVRVSLRNGQSWSSP